jgi:hypothetical protein
MSNVSFHVGFFARRLPSTRWIKGPNLCVFELPTDARQKLISIADAHPRLFEFAASTFNQDFCLVVTLVRAVDEVAAIESARQRVGHYIDGINLVVEETPVVTDTLIIHRAGESDAGFREAPGKGWLRLVPKDPKDLNAWNDARQKLFTDMWPFFITLLENGWDNYSELFRQLLYSMRLFRRASDTASYGLEYLCKWVAIEALAAADSKANKGQLLRERISSLFVAEKRATIAEEVRQLWDRRHIVAHEAKAEFFEEAASDPVFQVYIPRLNYFATIVTVFALGHLTSARNVAELWTFAERWQIPEEAIVALPATAQLIGATKIVLNHIVEWPSIGPLLDKELPAQPS